MRSLKGHLCQKVASQHRSDYYDTPSSRNES